MKQRGKRGKVGKSFSYFVCALAAPATNPGAAVGITKCRPFVYASGNCFVYTFVYLVDIVLVVVFFLLQVKSATCTAAI